MKLIESSMKNRWESFLRKFRQPKWRHGRWSIFVIAAFILICVLINVGVEVLEKELGWRKDFSFNRYATTGAETRAVLERLDKDVEIYLLYQGGEMQPQIAELLNRYDVLSDRVQVRLTDIVKNPGILNRFKGDMDSGMTADAVVVNCEETGRYRVLSPEEFVTWGFNIELGSFEMAGLAYEKILTESILYVVEENVPVIGVLQGHGELNMEQLFHFIAFLQSNNYDSKTVDLTAGESLEGIDLLLIAGAQKDFSEGEIQAIDAFTKEGGSLLLMRDYTDSENMPNYFSLLNNYGVRPLSGIVVEGEQSGQYFNEPIYIVPTMCELDMTRPLLEGGMDSLLLVGASAFEEPPEPDRYLTVGTVLKSSIMAHLRNPEDGYTGIDKQPGDPGGEFPLALYAHRMHANGNVSRLFAIGNSAIFTAEFIYQRTFNGEFMLQVLGELLPQKTVSLDIMASAAFHPGLRIGSQGVGLALIVAVPLLVLLAAFFILLPRRNR